MHIVTVVGRCFLLSREYCTVLYLPTLFLTPLPLLEPKPVNKPQQQHIHKAFAMDFAYSPHREGATMHLHSPTHPHYHPHLESLSSIQQLRRSLSRSPSKPSRFRLRSSEAQGSPISPLALARAFSPRSLRENTNNVNINIAHLSGAHNTNSNYSHSNSTRNTPSHTPAATHSDSPLATPVQAPTTKKRFTLRRAAPFRSSPRTRANSKSPRRVLAESTDHGNATPFMARHATGHENAPSRRSSAEEISNTTPECTPEHKSVAEPFAIDSEPIPFKLSSTAPGANCFIPPKSSPLKRSDGVMNFDTSIRSPNPKRRSLHAPSDLSGLFADMSTPQSKKDDSKYDLEVPASLSYSSPAQQAHTPLRKTTSLRKTTLSQRGNQPRPRDRPDHEFAVPAIPVNPGTRAKNRFSLDSSGYSPSFSQTPARPSYAMDSPRSFTQSQFSRSVTGSTQQPHPLSNTLTSTPGSAENSNSPFFVAPTAPSPRHQGFSRSLPIGATRPQFPEYLNDGLCATPMARPDPRPFQSTGLASKFMNKKLDDDASQGYKVPDTPLKRFGANIESAPFTTDRMDRSRGDSFTIRQLEFGTPSTLFSVHGSKKSTESYSGGTEIFGSLGSNHQRRLSFASIDGDDLNTSPSGVRMMDCQSSADDMPPTPTKPNDGSSRRSKDSSLRRKTFRQRVSLNTDTFTAPTDEESPAIDIPTSSTDSNPFLPHTPNLSSFQPLDASRLSISGPRRGSNPFNSSTSSSFPFPPATPTGHRDSANAAATSFLGLTQNDVDESLAHRFSSIKQIGEGEFSTVYKVEKLDGELFGLTPPSGTKVWAVKKTKKPYAGLGDRSKKLREVELLEKLRGHDHVISLVESWEWNQHLYIQTEFCENETLKEFSNTHGYRGYIDGFRIWKIALELSSVSLFYVINFSLLTLS